MTEYETQAQTFLETTGSTLDIKFRGLGTMPHWDDSTERDIYDFTLSNSKGSHTGVFGNSVVDTKAGKEPSAYDILACLQVDQSESFEDFCEEFGYDTDSRAAERTYDLVRFETEDLQEMYTEGELELLHEVQ